jgi:hemerythrin-like metal-binding protein
METIAWAPDFSIGVKSVDEQHVRLVEMLNNLGKTIDEGHGSEAIMSIVGEMSAYAQHHFQTEEAMMVATGYPKCSPHKQEHDSFIEEVISAADALESGGKITPEEVWAFLRKWLVEHILDSDKHMGAYLAAHGQT